MSKVSMFKILMFVLIVTYTVINDAQQKKLGDTPVVGTIVSIWESQGRRSSTLMYQVKFSYGVETINADGYRHWKHKEGDVFSASCTYVTGFGCTGTAYTGHVDSFWGRNSTFFGILQILCYCGFVMMVGCTWYDMHCYRGRVKLNK